MIGEQTTAEWVHAAGLADIPEAGSKLVRHFEKRIAIFKTPTGVYAMDNRCPHQGYALVKGDVRDDVLTCAWHNWKYDLTSGTCLFGGENVRTYPVQIRGSEVWLDVTDPPAEKITPQLFQSLNEALGEVDLGRVARDAMRLRRVGVPLAEIVREGVRFGAPRVEYGWNHSLATLTDCLSLAAFLDERIGTLPVIQGLSVVSETEVRRPYRPRPEPIDPVAEYGSVEQALLAYPTLVDEEQGEKAEALLRGLIANNVDAARIRHALLSAITDHFLGYGHPMIYCMKAFELLDEIGWSEADAVLGPLVPNMTLATRYDRLPYMARFLRAWKSAGLDVRTLAGRSNGAPLDDAAYRRSLLDGSPEDALTSLKEALEAGVSVPKLIDATARAASERFGRFDIDIDTDDTNEWGWLDVTHTLTYVDALRWAWRADPSPEVLRGLFHAAWFVQWTGQLDAKNVGTPPPPFANDSASAVADAVRTRDPLKAVSYVNGYTGETAALETALAQVAVEDEHVAPIMIAHSVKTTRAAIVESHALGERGGRTPLAAVARFLSSPKRERFVYAATLEAIAFVQGRSKGDIEENPG